MTGEIFEDITHQGGNKNKMGYLIHLERCDIEKKRAYSVGRFYILRKYIWYEGMYKAYRMFGS